MPERGFALPGQVSRSRISVDTDLTTIARFTVVLRRSLRTEHQLLERRLRLPASVNNSADYSRLLMLWSYVWAAVAATTGIAAVASTKATAPFQEIPFAATAANAELMMVTGNAEAALALDLAEIMPFSRPPARPRVPFAVSVDEASLWGVAYVLRGSSLGNQVLHPMILRQLGGRHASAFRYLTGSGSETRRDWSEFCDRLNQWGSRATELERGRALACAGKTFGLVGSVADYLVWDAGVDLQLTP